MCGGDGVAVADGERHKRVMNGTDEQFEAFKAQQISVLEESVGFFSNRMKPERELWVARHFLKRYLPGIDFAEVQIGDNPPDVKFRDFNFEIKEILDADYRRHTEYKRDLEDVRLATKYADFVKDVETSGRVSFGEFVGTLGADIETYGAKYSRQFLGTIDALFYVNMRGVFVRTVPESFIFPEIICRSNFRSISLLFNDGCLVVAVSPTAPNLLRVNLGRILRDGS
jgi:hypothetical protein